MEGVRFLWFLFLPVGIVCVMKDIVFLVDESSSISGPQFEQAVEFLVNVTNFLNIGNTEIQISLVAFESNTDKIFDLNSYTTKQALLQAMGQLQSRGPRGGGTSTDEALQYVLSRFKPSVGGRPGANKTVVVLTDGQSYDTNKTISSANLLRQQGIDVIGIGIGSLFSVSNKEILGIGGGPTNVMTVGDFKYLCNLVPSLVPKLDPMALNAIINRCPTEPTLPPTTRFSGITTLPFFLKTNMWYFRTTPKPEKEETSLTGPIVGATVGVTALIASVVVFLIVRKQWRNRKTSPRKVIASRPPCRTVFNPALLKMR